MTKIDVNIDMTPAQIREAVSNLQRVIRRCETIPMHAQAYYDLAALEVMATAWSLQKEANRGIQDV